MTTDPRHLAQEALQRADAATAGPWEWVDQERGIMAHDEMPEELEHPSHRLLYLKPVLGASCYPGQEGKVYISVPDCTFMVHARQDVPALATALLAALEDQERARRILEDRDASLSAEEYEQRAADDAALLASPKAGEILGAPEREALYERHLRWRTLAQVERLRAENEELRLTLAAEQGKPEGAPHPDWHHDAGTWIRYYADCDSAIVYSDGTWARGPFGECARHKGRAPNRRAAMLAADAALSGEATTSPSAPAPQGSQTPR